MKITLKFRPDLAPPRYMIHIQEGEWEFAVLMQPGETYDAQQVTMGPYKDRP